MPTDLNSYARLIAAITARLEVARAVAADVPPPWCHSERDNRLRDREGWPIARIGYRDGRFIAMHDPVDAILRYERDLRVAERHRPLAGSRTDLTICGGHPLTAPVMWVDCPESTDLLTVYPEATP